MLMSIPYGLKPRWGMGDTFIFMAALTDLDRQLLSALREDGRASVASLARKLGVARATVNSRLERLVSSGTIVGFTARVRDEVDPLAIRAIALIAVEGRSADKLIRQLRGPRGSSIAKRACCSALSCDSRPYGRRIAGDHCVHARPIFCIAFQSKVHTLAIVDAYRRSVAS
jgi:DNA-binding Lrp family transcriptional regulator